MRRHRSRRNESVPHLSYAWQEFSAGERHYMGDDEYYFEPARGHGLRHDPISAIVGPRPIGWISSKGKDGSVNIAPYSFFNVFNYTPPIVAFSSVGAKDTLRNVQESGEFVWNLATRALADRVNLSSASAPYGASEFLLTALTAAPSRLVAAPRVAESPVNFECKATEVIQLKDLAGHPLSTWLVLGEVIAVHIEQSHLKDGLFDTFGAGIVLRAGGATAYAEIQPSSRFDMTRPP